MNSYSDVSIIRTILADWYMKNQRNLPWRHTTDPYKIWISEIILQQTRIDQGCAYYERFIADFPDVVSLAASPLEKVMKRWQGLGYYSRARNLHETARHVATVHGGQFPADYNQLLKLKGIGTYTAAAIASISYKLPYAVLDGNVFRVLSRLFLVDTPIYTTEGKKQFSTLATNLLNVVHPDTHNQAIMEFGALQCVPLNPDCDHCPLDRLCLAHKDGCVTEVPVRKTASAKQNRYFNYFVCEDGHNTWLRERTGKDIWQHLWEFPLIETDGESSPEKLLERIDVSEWTGTSPHMHTPIKIRHILSHQIIHATFIHLTVGMPTGLTANFVLVPFDQLDNYPVSRLTDLFLLRHTLY